MFYISFLLIKIFLLVVITFLVTKSLTEKTKQLKMAEEDFTDKDYDATIEELPEVPPKIPDAHLDKVYFIQKYQFKYFTIRCLTKKMIEQLKFYFNYFYV